MLRHFSSEHPHLGTPRAHRSTNRRLYTGISASAIVGIGLSYAGLLWTRHQVDRGGIDLFNAYLTAELDHSAPDQHEPHSYTCPLDSTGSIISTDP